MLGFNTNNLIKNNPENDQKLKWLKMDAGRLIQKFQDLSREHDELEKLRRYAENQFHSAVMFSDNGTPGSLNHS